MLYCVCHILLRYALLCNNHSASHDCGVATHENVRQLVHLFKQELDNFTQRTAAVAAALTAAGNTSDTGGFKAVKVADVYHTFLRFFSLCRSLRSASLSSSSPDLRMWLCKHMRSRDIHVVEQTQG
jgi:hypothetical protein